MDVGLSQWESCMDGEIGSKVKEAVDGFLDDCVVVFGDGRPELILIGEKAAPFKKGKGPAPKAGTGQRFALCVQKIMKQKGWNRDRAEALCATIGRKKFGAKRFAKLGAAGRKRK